MSGFEGGRTVRWFGWSVVLGVLVAGGAGAEVRLSVFTGVGITADADLRIRQPDRGTDLVFQDVVFDDKSLSLVSAPYMGVKWDLLTEVRPRLSWGVEFLHFKIFSETDRTYDTRGTYRGIAIDQPLPMAAIVQQYDVANGVNLVMLNGTYRRRDLAGGRLEAYAGVGLGPTIPFTKATVDGEGGDGHYEFGRLGGQLFGGLLWPLGSHWDLFAEAKWTRTTVDGSVPGGESEADLSTRHATVGVGYRF